MPTTFALQVVANDKYDGQFVKQLTIDLDPSLTEINDDIFTDHFCLPRGCVIRITQTNQQEPISSIRWRQSILDQLKPLDLKVECAYTKLEIV